jgi:hypothetical protein
LERERTRRLPVRGSQYNHDAAFHVPSDAFAFGPVSTIRTAHRGRKHTLRDIARIDDDADDADDADDGGRPP